MEPFFIPHHKKGLALGGGEIISICGLPLIPAFCAGWAHGVEQDGNIYLHAVGRRLAENPTR